MKNTNQVMVCGAASIYMNEEGMHVTFMDKAASAIKSFIAR